MKLTIILVVLAVTQIFAKGYSQNIDLNVQDMPLEKVFALIEQQSGYVFFYDNQLVQDKQLSLKAENLSIGEILQSFEHLPLEFTIIKDKNIVVKRKARPVVSIGSPITPIQQPIRGKIMNNDGEPLEGVTISIKGSTAGTATDASGNFALSAPTGSTISVSMVGYLTQEMVISSNDFITITLEPDNQNLEEVVVTALGIERQTRSLTYSTQSVKSKELAETREPTLMLGLQGKVAGLAITESVGGVGSPVRVVLRGNRSISGDSQPLYIVDGVPTSTNIANVNPNNIASVNILKGANATALYGSAAQNGAIVIETKRGKAGVTSVNFTGNYVVTEPVILPKFQNTYGQGSEGIYDERSMISWGPKMDGQLVDHWSLVPEQENTEYRFSPQPNNIRDFYRFGVNASNNIEVLYGNENVQTAFTYNRIDAVGIFDNNTLKRNNLTLRINSRLLEKFHLDGKIDYRNDNNHTGGISSANTNLFLIPRNIRTEDMEVFEYRDVEGRLLQNFWFPNSGRAAYNPYWVNNRVLDENITHNTAVMLSLNYNIKTNLNLLLRGSYGSTFSDLRQKTYNDMYIQALEGRYSRQAGSSSLLNGEFLLSYEKSITPDFVTKIYAGGQVRRDRSDLFAANTGPALTVPNFFSLTNSSNLIANEDIIQSETQSLYSFLNFSWKNAIFLDLTARNDWSSTLPTNNRSYFYPSLGLGIVVSDLVNLPKAISFLKPRGSWSRVGSSANPHMLSRQVQVVGGGVNGFLNISAISPNPNMLPETTESFEVGLESRLFDGKINLDVTYYNTDTKNQLFTVNLPLGSGASQYYSNGGWIKNNGYEVILQADVIQKRHFTWNVNLNYSSNRSKVISISDERPRVEVGNIVIEEGQPWGNIYSRGFERDQSGNVLTNDDGLPLLTPNQTVKLANFNPNWLGGLSQTFTFKNFNLRFLIDHRQGGTMLSYINSYLYGQGVVEGTLPGREGGLIFGKNLFAHENSVMQSSGAENNIAISAEQFWRHIGGYHGQFLGEAFVENATNTRIREVSIGYTFPTKLLSKSAIKSINISVVGRNLFYLYRASETLDADLRTGTGPGSEGVITTTRPSHRTFGLNLFIGF